MLKTAQQCSNTVLVESSITFKMISSDSESNMSCILNMYHTCPTRRWTKWNLGRTVGESWAATWPVSLWRWECPTDRCSHVWSAWCTLRRCPGLELASNIRWISLYIYIYTWKDRKTRRLCPVTFAILPWNLKSSALTCGNVVTGMLNVCTFQEC